MVVYQKHETIEYVYGLRHSVNKLTLPKARTEHLKRGFSYSVAALRNFLHVLSKCNSLGVLKKNVKAYFSSLGSHTAMT